MKRLHVLSRMLLVLFSMLSGCGRDAAVTASKAEHEAHEPHEPGVAAEHDKHGASTAFTAEEISAAGIEVLVVGPARIREVLPLYGTVQPNAERTRAVAARFPGVIQKVQAAVGDTVREGQSLAVVESNESLRDYSVVAPLSGVITARSANPGETAGAAPLFTVSDLASVWVELAMFPRDFSRVSAGQEVRVRSIDGTLKGTGKIVYIAPVSEGGTQTLVARVLLDNRAGHWAPGLYVSAQVVLAEHEVPVAVKNTALQRLDDVTVVFVRTGEEFVARRVVVGASDGEWTQILSGITALERYAAANSFVVKSDLGAAEAGHDD
jgi:cobalt-zinc-cadmium efflux system membrane fusion protein